ncbi:nitronate monooxygenase [Streptomyces sp. 900105755]
MNGTTPHFVLMLTDRDVTIPDAVEVYSALRIPELRHVAFKDVGADPQMLRDLTGAAHADGRSVLLELADMSDRGQSKGLQLAVDLGVDSVVATWRAETAAALNREDAPAYWPFVGTLTGSPLELLSGPAELAAIAKELDDTPGVRGAVLMPYRQHRHQPSALLRDVTAATGLPVLVAGGVAGAEQIEDVMRAGAWGFTMGSALLHGREDAPSLVGRRVRNVLGICRAAMDRQLLSTGED